MITSPSAPQKLYLLPLSTSTVPLPGGRTLDMVLGCYLVETSDGQHVLIDTGFPADVPPPLGTPPLENATNVIAQLGELGLGPDDIDILICTHFDIDHVGYHDAFTKAELIVQREHYELLDLVEREVVALVIFGHDGQQWRTLRKAPECYV